MADPFSDRNALDANPFADPSVQGALAGQGAKYEEDYPGATASTFEDDDYSKGATAAPAATHGGEGRLGGAQAGRLEDLQRRERELEQRERDLEARADHIQKHGRNNWPPFYPIMYMDIEKEIPPDSRQVLRLLLYAWIVLGASLVINLVACIFLLGSGTDAIKDIIVSAFYLAFIPVASFMLWYRPVYNGLMKEHALFYYVFFVFGGFHIAWSVYMFLGIPSTGSCALLNTIGAWSGHFVVSGILGIIVTVGFAAQGLTTLWYYRIIWRHNHEQGHTFKQAQAELASHGAKAYFAPGNRV